MFLVRLCLPMASVLPNSNITETSVVAVFAQLSDKQGSLTVREHYASLWSLSIKTLVPNILNATGALAWCASVSAWLRNVGS